MRITAIIPARGGSKGIPGKNLVSLAGKPLLQHTVDAAKDALQIDHILVTSDDDRVLQLASALGVQGLRRPANLALDGTPSQPVIAHSLKTLKIVGADDYVMFLQPTSPLRTARHINEAVSLFATQKPRMLVSVVKPSNHPMKAYLLDSSGYLQGAYSSAHPYMPRQALPECYFSNGAIYLFSANDFLTDEDFPKEQIIPFLMTEEESVDIDTPSDLFLAERILERTN